MSLPHAGGALPILRGRLDQGFKVRPECKHLPRAPSEYLKRFTYDTISYCPEVMDYLVKLVGVDRILMGSDYCFDIAHNDPVGVVHEISVLDDAGKQAVFWDNAARLLRL